MKPLSALLFGLLPASFLSLLPSPVQAGETCNYLNYDIAMAMGFQNENQVWVSEGWWLLEPGECAVYPDSAKVFFQIDKDSPISRAIPQGAPSQSLCIVADRFTAYQADNSEACDSLDGAMVTFFNPGVSRELLKE
ncbi:MAG: DUF1036 domain-containing protein [Cyanobacteriota bacterium]|jgi:uncharacterized membrane protein